MSEAARQVGCACCLAARPACIHDGCFHVVILGVRRYDFCSEVPQLREAAEQYGLKRRGAAPKPAASAAEAEFNKAKGGGGGWLRLLCCTACSHHSAACLLAASSAVPHRVHCPACCRCKLPLHPGGSAGP